MSNVPPKKCPIAILMSNRTPVCPPDDPLYTAVLYEAHLEYVDESEPLWRVSYFGQVVRAGTAEENFAARKNEHELRSIKEEKDLGFHAVIDTFGADKIKWRIVSFKSGRRSAMSEWADAEEKRLIAEHGGVLRDMDAKLQQTLNLTEGGQKGDAAARWAGFDAYRRRSFQRFKAAMEAYVEEYESALVPQSFVDEDGYRLGSKLNDFRMGKLRKGMPEQIAIEVWAEGLPEWAWDARTTKGYREQRSKSVKDWWDTASENERAHRFYARTRKTFGEFKAAMEKYVEDHKSSLVPQAFVTKDGYALGSQLATFRKGGMRNQLPEEEKVAIVAWAQALPKWHWDARKSDEYRTEKAQKMVDRYANASSEDLSRWSEHLRVKTRKAFAEFKTAMEEYVKVHKTSLVPQRFVNKMGYRLGGQLNNFRQGQMRKGLPKEENDAIVAWAEALPHWKWKAKNRRLVDTKPYD